MTSKIAIAAGVVLAFVVGTMSSGLYTATSNAFNPDRETAVTAAGPVKVVPAVQTRFSQPRVAAVSNTTATPVSQRKTRSWQREALIIGGSAGAGAAIGAVSGGKKGAAIGAVSGGVAGLVYDVMTRNNR